MARTRRPVQMRARETPLVSQPIEYEMWPDGINPYLEPVRRDLILETRAERQAEIARWWAGHPTGEADAPPPSEPSALATAESSSSERDPDLGLFDLTDLGLS